MNEKENDTYYMIGCFMYDYRDPLLHFLLIKGSSGLVL